MIRALFVDHAFHRKTRSSDFFIEILRNAFEIEQFFLDPDGPADRALLAAARTSDLVILWQMDFLAPLFLAMGKPTIVIPMYDGSSGLPDLHWLFAHRARFCNFSLALHQRARLLGGETMLLRYFPPPVPENELPRFDKLSAFFWQRRPDHGVTIDKVAYLLHQTIDRFHLHNAADIAGHFPSTLPKDVPFKFTESWWFKKKAKYEACLASCNIFVAPRAAEGIGLALLEAMARGMVVIAHDAPTHNEYISNGINGVLFDKDRGHEPILLRDKAERIGRSAWRTVVEGHNAWNASHSAILEWIAGAEGRAPIDIDFGAFFSDLWTSFYAGLEEYQQFLRRHLHILTQLLDVPLHQSLSIIGRGTMEEESDYRYCPLDPTGLLDMSLQSNQHIGAGWCGPEPGWRWSSGKQSELFFTGLSANSKRIRATFVAASLPHLGKSVRCSILLNGQQVFDGQIVPDWKEYEFRFPSALVQHENRMELTFDKAGPTLSDPRPMAVRFESFRFVADIKGLASDRPAVSRNLKGRTSLWRHLSFVKQKWVRS
ncbi:MAG TPA: glycosyltransferase [Candidatus Sulfotelmatobacter sp.]|nr:glycosyltransferase [Candidatus Sulfotelmatobacter sp.]